MTGSTTHGWPIITGSDLRRFAHDMTLSNRWSDLKHAEMVSLLQNANPAAIAAIIAWYEQAVGPDDGIVAGLIDASSSATRSALDTKYIGRSEQVFDVHDFGAAGDGTTDDTAAIAAALAQANTEGGGTVLLAHGKSYMMRGYAEVHSNTKISGYGATLIKPPLAQRTSVAFFAVRTGGQVGYGAGGESVTIQGVTTVGRAWTSEAATLLSAHHARSVTIRDCVGHFCVARGHWIDLNGCEDVLVENCHLYGAAVASGSDVPAEAIQVDLSAADSMSVPDTGYDGLPSRRVTVRSSSFNPATRMGATYPAPVAFGTHTAPSAGSWYESLHFLDNYCGPTQPREEGVRGAVHFISAKGVLIRGNRIDSGGIATPAISIQSGFGDGRQIQSRNVVISDNTIEHFGASQAIRVSGARAVTVSGNLCTSDGEASMVNAVLLNLSELVTVTGNTVVLDDNAAGSGFAIRFNPTVTGGIVVGNLIFVDDGRGILVDSASVLRGDNQVISD